MAKAFELRQQTKKDAEEARKLLDVAEAEKRSLSGNEQERYDALMSGIEARKAEIARIEKLEVIEAELRTGGGRTLGEPLPHQVQTKHRYSVARAIHRMALRQLDGLEGEVHQELCKRSRESRGNEPKGLMIPYAMGPEPDLRTDLTTTTGAGSIPTILDQNLIEILRPRMVTAAAGATVMTDMQGLFAIPRQNATSTGQWVAEGNSITLSNQTIDQVPFSPKTFGDGTNYSRKFLEQTNQNAEAFVRKDLMSIVARGCETAAFLGTGAANNQPTGISQNTSIQTLSSSLTSGTNGGAVTWANLVLMEQLVATANADLGKLAYITDSAVRGHLKRTLKISGSTFPIFLWEGGQTPVNEYPCHVTNLLGGTFTKGSTNNAHAMFYGNWEDLVFAFWTGMDVIVDPYTGAAAGATRVIVLQDSDINVRHPESFSMLTDIVPS